MIFLKHNTLMPAIFIFLAAIYSIGGNMPLNYDVVLIISIAIFEVQALIVRFLKS